MSGTAEHSGRGGVQKGKGDQSKPNSGFTARCPTHLNANGKRFWHQIVEDLEGILQNKDQFALEDAALSYQTVLLLTKKLKSGMTFKKKLDRGAVNIAIRPEVALLKEAKTQLKNMLIQFGLTPKSGKTLPRKAKRGGAGGSMKEKYGS